MKRTLTMFAAALLTALLAGWFPAQGAAQALTPPSEPFELPLNGASGYAAIPLTLYGSGDIGSIGELAAGAGFTVIRESNEWWQVRAAGAVGWVLHQNCMINLPDVIPSIVYDNTNAYASLFRSSGKEVPEITGAALYQARDMNDRFGKERYIVPAMYGMAPKIAAAQKAALADGNTLVIYEAFRPADAHTKVYNSLTQLVKSDPEVYNGVTGNTFTMGWFLAPAPYNHQRGTAIDVSLAKIVVRERHAISGYEYTEVANYVEYPMQTAMHELSLASTIYTTTSGAALSPDITAGSLQLQKYCVGAGLMPLASEWWHFNDAVETNEAIAMGSVGWYTTPESFSAPPEMK